MSNLTKQQSTVYPKHAYEAAHKARREDFRDYRGFPLPQDFAPPEPPQAKESS